MVIGNGVKRGELTTQQIVTLVILIASFAVLLIFISNFDFTKEADKDICHNSVILAARSPVDIVLDCKTRYIEIEAEEQIFETIAEEMSQCWWQFGRGKLDFVNNKFFKGTQCGICSRIEFGEGLDEGSFVDLGSSLKSYLDSEPILGGDISYKNYMGLNLEEDIIKDIKKDSNLVVLFKAFDNPNIGKDDFRAEIKLLNEDDIKKEGCEEFITLS